MCKLKGQATKSLFGRLWSVAVIVVALGLSLAIPSIAHASPVPHPELRGTPVHFAAQSPLQVLRSDRMHNTRGTSPQLDGGGWYCATYTFANKWTNPLRFAATGLLTACDEPLETVDVTFDLYYGVKNGDQIDFFWIKYWHGCTIAPVAVDGSYYCPDFQKDGVSAWTLDASPGDIWGVKTTWRGFGYDGTAGTAVDFQYVEF